MEGLAYEHQLLVNLLTHILLSSVHVQVCKNEYRGGG